MTAATIPLLYVETDIPAGLTIREWRRLRASTAKRHRRHAVARLVRRLAFA